MLNIQMVDLQRQYGKLQAEIDAAVLAVLKSGAYINGPEVRDFQAELEAYLGVKHVIPCANGTDALQIAHMALDLPDDAEVICPTWTYVSTVEVVGLLKLKPVLVDVDYDNFNIDLQALEKALTPKSKVLLPVHLYGQCAPLAELKAFADAHGLYLIEDTAQALGATYTFPDGRKAKAGTVGAIGGTSFYPSKNLGCYGDGGALFTNDDALAARLRRIANHGQNRRYYFDEVGVNSRLDSIQAAILRIKLRKLDAFNSARQAVAAQYDAAFSDVPALRLPGRVPYSDHVFHQYTLRVTDGQRDALQDHLNQQRIPNSIFYPLPIHQQPPYAHAQIAGGAAPVSEQLAREAISLPMHPDLTEAEIAFVTQSVRQFFGA
jgi:dTDP-4-amino-4,6-dideoxygalactose transaminase